MRARRSDSGDKLAYGISFVFFGLLFLLDILGFFRALHVEKYVMDWRNFFIYAGFIFLCAKKEKALGLVLLIIGIFLRFQGTINSYLPTYSAYFWPVLMIIIGAILLILVLRK
jgi:hypothetical protein